MNEIKLSVAEIKKGDHFLKDKRQNLINEIPKEIELEGKRGKASILDQKVVLTRWEDEKTITVGYTVSVEYNIIKSTKDYSVVNLTLSTQVGDFVELPMDATLKDIVEATNKNIEKVKKLIVNEDAIKKLFDEELETKNNIVW